MVRVKPTAIPQRARIRVAVAVVQSALRLLTLRRLKVRVVQVRITATQLHVPIRVAAAVRVVRVVPLIAKFNLVAHVVQPLNPLQRHLRAAIRLNRVQLSPQRASPQRANRVQLSLAEVLVSQLLRANPARIRAQALANQQLASLAPTRANQQLASLARTRAATMLVVALRPKRTIKNQTRLRVAVVVNINSTDRNTVKTKPRNLAFRGFLYLEPKSSHLMGIKPRSQTLKRAGKELADTFIQLEVIQRPLPGLDRRFEAEVQSHWPEGQLRTLRPRILQVNLGKLCNQTCAHCHVDAGPDRKTELMSAAHVQRCLDILAANPSLQTLDITGGAPEMHPLFRDLVRGARALGREVIDRCNLTILSAGAAYADLAAFLAENRVHVVSSLPHYARLRTDSQRGDGVFEASVQGIAQLNALGYGQADSGLQLDLVYNPAGAFLPGSQTGLEQEFKRELQRRHGLVFNRLLTITNMPISRFLDYLLESGNYEAYMQKLIEAFNPATLAGLMCRDTLSVSWQGELYDCDFNQMLDLKVKGPIQHLDQIEDLEALAQRPIVLGQHCYGCTAGAGSSCGGAVAE